ncbi:MAG: hypothetical protein J5I52_07480 [Saprospiraceae bacterium]|nr:MAG: hypothetical protein UZ09_BCD002001245 [Bacteroidetes bacterium OLB9]MCO6463974.1 hypothetical protein [Saprospiraceae bacterium]
MKNLNILTVVLIACFYFSCEKDDHQKTDPIPCVTAESITDTISGFLIFEKGKQENGFAKGIKINKPFESSVFLFNNSKSDTLIDLQLKGYWLESNGYFAEGEVISFSKIKETTKCQKLTNNRESVDSVIVSYSIVYDDAGFLLYELDLSADNALEIISFDSETNKLKAKFKGSFISKKEYLPDLPKKVRFSDVYIEYGY